MKNTTYILYAMGLLILAIGLYWGYGIEVALSIYLYIIIFLVIIFFVITFFSGKNKIGTKKSETVDIMKRVYSIMKELNLPYELVDLIRASTCTVEALNTTFKGFIFSTFPDIDGVALIWNTKKEDIDDIYPSPDALTQKNIFEYFDPYIGKFVIPSDRRASGVYMPLKVEKEEKQGDFIEEGEEDEL